MQVHIVTVAYDGEVSVIVRRDIGDLISDLIDNHGTDGENYRYVEDESGLKRVVEQIEDESGIGITYQTQEV